jgi:hypothetical protein
MARSEPGRGISCLIVSLEDMVELETIKLLLQLPNLLPVSSHAGVAVVQLSHDLVDDELRVTADVKPMNPKLDGDVQTVDGCLIFHLIVGCTKVYLNHVEELISFRRDQHYASPGLVEGERAMEIHAPMVLGD